jgi:hypothetical protein
VTVVLNEDGTYSQDTGGLLDYTIHDEGRRKLDGGAVKLTTLEGPASVPIGPDDGCYATKAGLIVYFEGGQITLKKQ